MRRPQKDIQLTTYDDLLGISEIDDTDMDKVIEVPLAELFPFKNHVIYVKSFLIKENAASEQEAEDTKSPESSEQMD